MRKFWYWIIWIILYLPLRIVFPVKVIGKKNNKFKGKRIIVGNHLHGADPFLLAVCLGMRFNTLAKKELEKKFFLRTTLKSFGAIFVDRGNADLAAARKILQRLKDGENLMLFPEGTRNRGDVNEMLAVKNGAAMFAIKTKTVIVPCRFNRRLRAFRRTILVIGKPFELKEYYDKKLTAELLDEAGAKVGNNIKNVGMEYSDIKRGIDKQQG